MDDYILHSLAEGALITGLKVAPVHSPCPGEAQGQAEQQDRRHAVKDEEPLAVKSPKCMCVMATRRQITDSQTIAQEQHAGGQLRRNTLANRHLDFEPCMGMYRVFK